MRNPGWRTLVSGALGGALAFTLWIALAAPYASFLARAGTTILRLAESPSMSNLATEGSSIVVDRGDLPRRGSRPALRSETMTVNFILLVVLFACASRPLSDRNVARFFAALASLAAVHVLALIVNVQSIYALDFGRWSEEHYGKVALNVWTTAAHFYNVVGIWAAAFLLWWAFKPNGDEKPVRKREKR